MPLELITFLIIMSLMTLLFIIAQIQKDNSIVDIFWGLGFCVVAIFSLIRSGNTSVRAFLVTGLVLIWGTRLAWYIARRNIGQGEDFRYVEMRKRWGKFELIGAYLNVFVLQGVLMFLISLPAQMSILYGHSPINLLDISGTVIWLVGFYFEAAGDAQMKRFKSDAANKGKIMTSGLWSLTRHPNYFGEILMWWGIFIIALNASHWYASLFGSLLITFFLMKVSGVPMLEKKYKDNPEYQEYIRKTPELFPRPF